MASGHLCYFVLCIMHNNYCVCVCSLLSEGLSWLARSTTSQTTSSRPPPPPPPPTPASPLPPTPLPSPPLPLPQSQTQSWATTCHTPAPPRPRTTTRLSRWRQGGRKPTWATPSPRSQPSRPSLPPTSHQLPSHPPGKAIHRTAPC